MNLKFDSKVTKKKKTRLTFETIYSIVDAPEPEIRSIIINVLSCSIETRLRKIMHTRDVSNRKDNTTNEEDEEETFHAINNSGLLCTERAQILAYNDLISESRIRL